VRFPPVFKHLLTGKCDSACFHTHFAGGVAWITLNSLVTNRHTSYQINIEGAGQGSYIVFIFSYEQQLLGNSMVSLFIRTFSNLGADINCFPVLLESLGLAQWQSQGAASKLVLVAATKNTVLPGFLTKLTPPSATWSWNNQLSGIPEWKKSPDFLKRD